MTQESSWGTKATLNKARVGRFVWDVYNYLYVDNVRCVGTTINKGQVANSSNSVQPKSSSSIVKPASSSTFGPTSSNSTIPTPFSSAIVATSSESTTFIGNITDKLATSYNITKANDYMLDGTYLVRISGKSGIMTTKVIVK